MKVAYLLKSFPRLSETFILNEVLALRAQGVEVMVCAMERSRESVMHPEAERLLPEVIFATRSPMRTAGSGLPRRQKVAVAWGRALVTRLRRAGVQHVHAHFAGPAASAARVVAQGLGVSYSFTAHAKDIFADSVDWDWVTGLGHDAAAVVTVCDFNRRWLRRRMPLARLVRIHNGVDLERWCPPARPVADGPVVAVGRLVHKKGLHILLDALARLRDLGTPLRAVIVGEGREREALLAQSRMLGLGRWVRFTGARTQPQVRRLMARASLVTLPCVVDEDGNQDALPTVLLEAHAAGLPVVATHVAGVPEIVRHGRTGLVVQPGDSVALARALRALQSSPARRARMGRAARAHAVARFDQRHAVRSLMRVFARSISEHRERPGIKSLGGGHAHHAAVC